MGAKELRPRGNTRQTEDTKRAKDWEDGAMKITGPLGVGLPVGAYPRASISFGIPSKASEAAGLRHAHSHPQGRDCSSYTSLPSMV